MSEQQLVPMDPSLENYLCPACFKNRSNLRWWDNHSQKAVIACSETCAFVCLKVAAKLDADLTQGLGLIYKARTAGEKGKS